MNAPADEQEASVAIAARSRGAATRLLGLSWQHDYQALVAAPQSSVRRVRDLHDRRVGLPTLAASRPARAAALRGALSALESQGLNHRHVQWVELPPDPVATQFAADLLTLQRGTVDAIYVRGAAGIAAVRSLQARVLFDIGAQRDPWLRQQTALLTATVADAADRDSVVAREAGIDEDTLQVAHDLKHFLLRWEFMFDDFDLRAWAHLRPKRSAIRRNADLRVPMFSQVQ
jgi:ABC-type nitrate/sulfonate/bicarbonate transport system substrate-binding protein